VHGFTVAFDGDAHTGGGTRTMGGIATEGTLMIKRRPHLLGANRTTKARVAKASLLTRSYKFNKVGMFSDRDGLLASVRAHQVENLTRWGFKTR
jgi:hypothetical protein